MVEVPLESVVPFPWTKNRLAPVVLATWKRLVVGADWVEVETESCAHGVVVPMPMAEVVAETPVAE